MNQYKTLFEFSRPEFLSDVQVSREQDQGMLHVWLQAEGDEEGQSIELSGFESLADAVSALLQAEWARVSAETNCGQEFGAILIECQVAEKRLTFRCDGAVL